VYLIVDFVCLVFKRARKMNIVPRHTD